MIVCHCHRVTDKDILKLVEKGAKTLEDIQCGCDACTDCEGCEQTILDILEKTGKKPLQKSLLTTVRQTEKKR